MSLLFPADGTAQRRRDRILAVLFAALMVAMVLRAARKDAGVLARNQDFGARFVSKEDPYFDPIRGEKIHGPYPPSFVLLAAPLSLLPTTTARVVWASAQALALAAVFLVLRGWARRWWPALAPHASVLYAIALLLVSRYLARDMAGGGGNLLFAALALRGLDLFLRGQPVAAGLPLALSFVLKPNLAPLLLFLAARKAWRTLACATALGAILFFLPALSFGWERYLALSSHWAGDVLAYGRLDDPRQGQAIYDDLPHPESGMNQSLSDAIHRALDPLAGISAAAWIARATALALVLLAFGAAWKARGERSVLLAGLAFLPLCLLVSPLTWKAHHAALLPLFFALACVAARKGRWSALATGLALYWVACDLLSEEIVGSAMKERLQCLSIVTWADVVLLGVAIVLAVRATSDGSRA